MKFKPGQKVVCRKHVEWTSLNRVKWLLFWKKNIICVGPKFNEIVTCDGYNATNAQFPDRSFMFLKEYDFVKVDGQRGAYDDSYFEPLVEDEQLAEELKQIEVV